MKWDHYVGKLSSLVDLTQYDRQLTQIRKRPEWHAGPFALMSFDTHCIDPTIPKNVYCVNRVYISDPQRLLRTPIPK